MHFYTGQSDLYITTPTAVRVAAGMLTRARFEVMQKRHDAKMTLTNSEFQVMELPIRKAQPLIADSK